MTNAHLNAHADLVQGAEYIKSNVKLLFYLRSWKVRVHSWGLEKGFSYVFVTEASHILQVSAAAVYWDIFQLW